MLRPRISLLSALLLMTVVGMAIVIVQLWREVGPLRAEVIARRAEMGQLFVADPAKNHAIGVDWDDNGRWRWRLHLQKRQILYTYIGRYSAYTGDDFEPWLAGIRAGKGRVVGSGSGLQSGEFTLDIKLFKESDRWYIQEDKNPRQTIPTSFHHLLDDPKGPFVVSRVVDSDQTIYERGEPILLLCIQKASEFGPIGTAGDTIVFWIEEDD